MLTSEAGICFVRSDLHVFALDPPFILRDLPEGLSRLSSWTLGDGLDPCWTISWSLYSLLMRSIGPLAVQSHYLDVNRPNSQHREARIVRANWSTAR